MALDRPHPSNWRQASFLIATRLESAHALVHAAGPAVGRMDGRSDRRGLERARTALEATAGEVDRFRRSHAPSRHNDGVEATGAALALRSSRAATTALAVLLEAVEALLRTDADDDTDVLVSASIDAEQSFEVSTAVVKAAPRSHGSAMLHLERAFEADGEIALRRRVVTALSAVGDINRRVRHNEAVLV